QAVTESLVLASIGGALGCGVAALILRIIISIAPVGIPRLAQAAIDLHTAAFCIAITVMSSILFGVIPALSLPSAERLNDPGVAGRQSFWGPGLVTFQLAISLVLLTSAGLLLRTFWNIQNVPLGMNAEKVIVAPVVLPPYRYPTTRFWRTFFEDLES